MSSSSSVSSGLNLPLDILDHIFQSFTDLQSLHAAILTCKNFHAVLREHASAIRKAILLNRLGDEGVLVPALREARTAIYHDGHIKPRTFQEALGGLSERSVAAGGLDVTWTETRLLLEHAAVLETLEVCFSRSQKDRTTASVSRLTPDESLRFRKAVYRAWTFHHAYRLADVINPRLDWFRHRPMIIARKAAFYDELTPLDLHDIGIVFLWADKYAVSPRKYDLKQPAKWRLLELGPAVYAEGCVAVDRENKLDVHREVRFSWASDVQEVWKRGGVEHEYDGFTAVMVGAKPLVEPVGVDDICSHCGTRAGLGLWNESNWAYLADGLKLWCPVGWQGMPLPGGLASNLVEYTLIRLYIDNPTRTDLDIVVIDHYDKALFDRCPYGVQGESEDSNGPISIPRILREMFDLTGDVVEPTLTAYLQDTRCDGFAKVQPKDWLCYPCLRKFVKARFWIWWYHQRASGKVYGRPLQKTNCRKGFDCDMQHDRKHFEEQNHLCIPESYSATREQEEDSAAIFDSENYPAANDSDNLGVS